MSLDISVVLLTFNHEKYISFALYSILNQKFRGSFDVSIWDDFSNDKTFKILEDFQAKFPKLIKVYRNHKNIGLAKNFQKAISHSKGRYIAYLEGDDYWTDTFKLQKQFDFLENNTRFVLAFHNFVNVDAGNQIISEKNLSRLSIQKNRTQKEMVTGCLIHQNAMMFRNIVQRFPKGFFLAKNHDTFFIAYLAKWGEAAYVACNPLHYRIHSDSLWSSLSGKQKHWNGLITFIVILFYVSPRFYGNVLWKIGSKIKSLILN